MQYLNYASLGFTIGHEVTHAFDRSVNAIIYRVNSFNSLCSTGSLFDDEGTLFNWWSNSTRKIYEEKLECLKEQFNNFTDPFTELKLNGSNTLQENTADHGEANQHYL